MKKIIPLLAVTAVLMNSCGPNTVSETDVKTPSFTLIGEVDGFPDSTWLFLDVVVNRKIKPADSTIIVNDKFRFTGSVPDSVTSFQSALRTKDFSDYKFVWLENSEIRFQGNKGDFRKARITGSMAQADDDLHSRRLMPLEKAADSLRRLLFESKPTETRKKELTALLHQADESRMNKSMEFIREHPESIVSASILNVYGSAWGKEITTRLYNSLSEKIKTTSYGKDIDKYITLNKDLRTGDQFVDFEQASYRGQKIKLSDFRGKIVLLEFWAAWCGPCRQENPSLLKTYQTYKGKGFEILGVSLDEDKKYWLEAIEKDGLIWENVSDLKGPMNSAALMYGVSGIPDNFLIDKDGKIIDRNLRGEKLRERLKGLLN